MRQEKGITILSLVITVIILIIVAGVGINVASPLIGRAKAEDVTTQLMLVQAWWKSERERVNFDGTSKLPAELIETEGDNKGKLKEAYDSSGASWVEENVTYYKLSQEALNSMGLEKLKEEDGYVVNYENDEIIYLNGYEEKGITYYKLSEIKEL